MKKELEIKKVTFEFEDGTQKILEGEEFANWRDICGAVSDYLLPGNSTHIFGKAFGGLVQGFMPHGWINT